MDETPTTDTNPDGEESTTDSPAKRHRFTNDTLAFVLTVGFSAAVIADGAGVSVAGGRPRDGAAVRRA